MDPLRKRCCGYLHSGGAALPFVACIMLAINLCSFLFPPNSFATAGKADKLIVIKGKRILILLKDGEILKTYRVSLGKSPEGHKVKTGDNKTPEGRYILISRNPNSRFHLAIRISYPNESDLQNANMLGVSPGRGIMIHGLPDELADIGEYHRYLDWTDGCIAVTNPEMEEIWQMVDTGTPIEIKP